MRLLFAFFPYPISAHMTAGDVTFSGDILLLLPAALFTTYLQASVLHFYFCTIYNYSLLFYIRSIIWFLFGFCGFPISCFLFHSDQIRINWDGRQIGGFRSTVPVCG